MGEFFHLHSTRNRSFEIFSLSQTKKRHTAAEKQLCGEKKNSRSNPGTYTLWPRILWKNPPEIFILFLYHNFQYLSITSPDRNFTRFHQWYTTGKQNRRPCGSDRPDESQFPHTSAHLHTLPSRAEPAPPAVHIPVPAASCLSPHW